MKTRTFFQFRKQDIESSIMSLTKYAEIMTAYPYLVNPKCNTLWLPVTSSNRTATLNLNHCIESFTDDGYLIGENGNCGTSYMVIMVPNCWTDKTVDRLAEMVKMELAPDSEKEAIRFLTPGRIETIEIQALLIGNNP